MQKKSYKPGDKVKYLGGYVNESSYQLTPGAIYTIVARDGFINPPYIATPSCPLGACIHSSVDKFFESWSPLTDWDTEKSF